MLIEECMLGLNDLMLREIWMWRDVVIVHDRWGGLRELDCVDDSE